MAGQNEIGDVKRRHSARLLAMPGVAGVGVAKGKNGEDVISLHLETDDPGVTAALPKEIEGYPVELVHSGPFRKFSRTAEQT